MDDYRISEFELPTFQANIATTEPSENNSAILTPTLLKPPPIYSQDLIKDYTDVDDEGSDVDEDQVIHVDMSIFSQLAFKDVLRSAIKYLKSSHHKMLK